MPRGRGRSWTPGCEPEAAGGTLETANLENRFSEFCFRSSPSRRMRREFQGSVVKEGADFLVSFSV